MDVGHAGSPSELVAGYERALLKFYGTGKASGIRPSCIEQVRSVHWWEKRR